MWPATLSQCAKLRGGAATATPSGCVEEELTREPVRSHLSSIKMSPKAASTSQLRRGGAGEQREKLDGQSTVACSRIVRGSLLRPTITPSLEQESWTDAELTVGR